MIELISNTIEGICSDPTSYNVFCYADGVLLTSSAGTSLQGIIDVADKYISSHGLQFMTMTMNLFSNLHLYIFTIYISYINNYSFVQIGGPM